MQHINDMIGRFIPVGEDWGDAARWIASKSGYGSSRVEVAIVHADSATFSLGIFFRPNEAPPAEFKSLADYPPVLAMAHGCRLVYDYFVETNK